MKAFVTLLLLTSWYFGFSQSCQEKLQDAERAYLNGALPEVETHLQGCLDSELSKEDRFDAYKLMVDSKLLLNEDESADIYMQKLLSLDPNYKPREVDLDEFKALYNTYDLRTKYTYGLSLGMVRPDYVILYPRSYSGQFVQDSDYEEVLGFSIGATGTIEIIKSIYGEAGLLFSSRSFKTSEEIMGFRQVAAEEKDYYLDVPLQLKYVFPKWRVKPFVGGGYALQVMLSASGNIDHWPLDTGIPAFNGIPYTTSGYNLTSQRTTFAHNWMVSAGLQYDIRDFLLELNVAYERGLTNLINAEERYSNRELLETYAYVPDDYKVNSYVVSIRILRKKVKPVKDEKP